MLPTQNVLPRHTSNASIDRRIWGPAADLVPRAQHVCKEMQRDVTRLVGEITKSRQTDERTERLLRRVRKLLTFVLVGRLGNLRWKKATLANLHFPNPDQLPVPMPNQLLDVVITAHLTTVRDVFLELCHCSPALPWAAVRCLAPRSAFVQSTLRRPAPVRKSVPKAFEWPRGRTHAKLEHPRVREQTPLRGAARASRATPQASRGPPARFCGKREGQIPGAWSITQDFEPLIGLSLTKSAVERADLFVELKAAIADLVDGVERKQELMSSSGSSKLIKECHVAAKKVMSLAREFMAAGFDMTVVEVERLLRRAEKLT